MSPLFKSSTLSRFFTVIIKLREIFLKSKHCLKLIQSREDCNEDLSKIREIFENLGPTFIKLGQMLSLRVDLLPKEFCEGFAKLLDEGEPLKFDEVKSVIENELKIKSSQIFKDINKKPIATASLAQVHLATLKSGKKVAIKIQKPNIERVIKQDLAIIKFLFNFLRFLPTFRSLKLKDVVNEFARFTQMELDFRNEIRNAEVFKKNFSRYHYVKVPRMYKKYCTRKLLVMDYLNGLPLSKLLKLTDENNRFKTRAINVEQFVDRMTKVYFKQWFEDGIFHADPHPANIILMKGGDIGFVDFGIMGVLTPMMQAHLFILILAIVEADVDALSELALHVSESKNTNEELLKKKIGILFGEMWATTSLKDLSIAQIFYKVMQILGECGASLGAEFSLFGRQLLTLDGLALKIYPEYNLMEEMKPFLHGLIRRQLTDKFSERRLLHAFAKLAELTEALPASLSEILEKIKQGEMKVKTYQEGTPSLPKKISLIFSASIAILVLNLLLTLNIATDTLTLTIPLGRMGLVLTGTALILIVLYPFL